MGGTGLGGEGGCGGVDEASWMQACLFLRLWCRRLEVRISLITMLNSCSQTNIVGNQQLYNIGPCSFFHCLSVTFSIKTN